MVHTPPRINYLVSGLVAGAAGVEAGVEEMVGTAVKAVVEKFVVFTCDKHTVS